MGHIDLSRSRVGHIDISHSRVGHISHISHRLTTFCRVLVTAVA